MKNTMKTSKGAMKCRSLALPVIMAFVASLTSAQTLTPVQQAIVNAARGVSGTSPASHMSLTWNGVTKSTWLTDTASGDGQRMRNAILRFARWRSANRGKPVPSTVISGMQSDLLPSYTGTDSTNIVYRIINVWDTKTAQCLCSLAPPQTDEQTLTFLGIRQQCREWVDTIVIKAGGTPRTYGTGIQYAPSNFRPGMGLYFPNIPHASIITDIYRNADGSVKQFKIAEANWGSGWSNPPGMAPWSRTLQNTRTLDWLGSNTCRVSGTTKTYTCHVVSFQ